MPRLSAVLLTALALLLVSTPVTPISADSKPAEGVAKYADWTILPVPGTWDEHTEGALADYDGFAWYRCLVTVPRGWKDKDLALVVANVDNAHEAYFNGKKVGGSGSFPPNYQSGLAEPQRYTIPAAIVTPGADNVVAIRIYDHEGRGGFKGAAPALIAGDKGIALNGRWEFRIGDDLAWANETKRTAVGIFWRIVDAKPLEQGVNPGDSIPPATAVTTFTVPSDLKLDLAVAEPEVRQPVFLNFDERGRMWVVQFLQYPYPAGLNMISKDEFWRAVWDKVPPPPPNHFVGADRITIHEDTDGDGVFDKHKVFVEGLNITSACCRGRGGVWVLNAPYLLFYPDRDNDDIPDGDPEVHLQGFGMEDTHSVANSLRFGPDGWIYGAQGSTVSGHVVRPGSDEEPVHSLGQLIWRYHPELRKYEIFAEGGGNSWAVEFDAKGRIFSGHNGGDTRGFHYVQGGYYQKGFTKHGPLSNPYAFGYFEAMAHHSVPRFTHNFIIYEGAGLPADYQGRLFGVEPLQGRVVMSEVAPDRSSFKTKDLSRPVITTDVRFRPVEIKAGPDGAIYVADMYEPQISHREHFAGQIDKETGRIYRLSGKDTKAIGTFDLSKKSSTELVGLLTHPNKWYRQTALRLIGDRKDASIIPLLKEKIDSSTGQDALEYFWALYQSGGFDDAVALKTLHHADPYVRLWTVRVLGDANEVTPTVGRELGELARTEPHVEVRVQLASSAKRLPAETALPIVRNLLTHDDKDDVFLPLLLWWAMESKVADHPELVLQLFEDPQTWKLPTVQEHLLDRLMRRFAASGSRQELLYCSRLLALSPGDEFTRKLMAGFEEAYKGRSLAGLPKELAAALSKAGGGSTVLRVRQGEAQAIELALKTIGNEKAKNHERFELIQVFGEVKEPRCVPVLLTVAETSSSDDLRMAALTALQRYDNPEIGTRVLAFYHRLPVDVVGVAQTLLSSRRPWAMQLLAAVDAGQIKPESVPLEVVRKLTVHKGDEIARLVSKHWGDVEGATTAEMQQQIERLQTVLQTEGGNPHAGKKLFMASCGKCHVLFGEGGKIGPDLTSFKRDDITNMLVTIINPSAEVREGFETLLIVTDDGRTVSGFLADRDQQVLVLRGIDGQDVTLAQDRIEEIIPQKKSLMPEGLLKDFTDEQVRDLFAYLRSTQPIR